MADVRTEHMLTSRGRDSPEQHQEEEEIAKEANPNKEEELDLPHKEEEQVEELEHEPEIPVMADNKMK